MDKSGRKPKKTWFDKGSEFYNSSFKKWLKGDDIEMYAILSEGIYAVAKIYKYMSSISKKYIHR